MKELSEKDFDTFINRDKLVVVDFFARWCIPCRFFMPVLERLEKSYNGKVEFAKVDVDKDPKLAIEYDIETVPTVIIFYRGEVVGGFLGAVPEKVARKEIDRLLRKYCGEENPCGEECVKSTQV